MMSNPTIADQLRNGAVIAYPTEGVWGLGCVPENETAVRKILTLKQRPVEKGLILIASSMAQILPYVKPLNDDEVAELEAAWPGHVTFVIAKSAMTPAWVSGQFDTVAVRVSAHPVVREICEEIQQPIISTSANPGSLPPATTAQQVLDYFGDQLDYVVSGELGGASGPSQIRELGSSTVIRGGG